MCRGVKNNTYICIHIRYKYIHTMYDIAYEYKGTDTATEENW